VPPPYREWRGGGTSATPLPLPYSYAAARQRRLAEVAELTDQLPDGRWQGLCARAFSLSHNKPHGSEVMKHSLLKARMALAAIPRCTAMSRQTGEPCKLPGTGAGGKCRFHGGASTGRPPTHGRNTEKARLERDWARLLLGAVASCQGGKVKFFKPGRLTVQRVQEVLNAKISK
jgi:hypothetical protein